MSSVFAVDEDLVSPAEGTRERVSVRWWSNGVMLLLLGYFLLSRAFAYVGIARYQLFIGDVFLVAFFVLRPADSGRAWLGALIRRNELSLLAWALYAFVAYGLILTARGIAADHDTTQTIKNLVFNIYPLFLFVGLWLGRQDRGFLARFVLALAWANAIYGIAFLLVLNSTSIVMPGAAGVFLFNNPQGQAVAILGLISFHRDIRRTWFPLLVNILLLVVMQTRAHWVGFAIALPVWAILSRRVGKTLIVGSVVAAVLVIGFVADAKLPDPLSRGPSQISARAVVGAALAPFDEATAAQYTDQAGLYAGTAAWRTHWWSDLWRSVNTTTQRTLIGYGYGYYLKSASTISSGDDDLRTPHNVFFYAFGYGGWIGVATFAFLFAAAGRLLWLAYRRTRQGFGLALLALGLGIGLFTNYFETPYAAIPFWTLIGLAAAPALFGQELDEDDVSEAPAPQSAPA